MKIQLIMYPTPIIVSDEDAVNEDLVLYVGSVYRVRNSNLWDIHTNKWVCMPNIHSRIQPFKKVIAGLDGLPEINWNGLENDFKGSNGVENKEFDIQVEMEYIPGLRREATPYSKNYIPKITDNSLKILKITY